MSLFAARQALNDLRGQQRLSSADTRYGLTKAIVEEAEERRKEEEKRAKGAGIGRFLGTGAGALGSLLLAPVTGGGSLAAMLLSGGLGGLGSFAGQKVGGLHGDPKSGDFMIEQDKLSDKEYGDNLFGQAGMDAVTSALLAGALKKAPVPKDTDFVSDQFMNKLRLDFLNDTPATDLYSIKDF